MKNNNFSSATLLISCLGIEDDTVRRDSMHAIINGLPDPNYATLRTLVLVSSEKVPCICGVLLTMSITSILTASKSMLTTTA